MVKHADDQSTLDVIRSNSACALTLQSVRIGESEASSLIVYSDWPVLLTGGYYPIRFRSVARQLTTSAFLPTSGSCRMHRSRATS